MTQKTVDDLLLDDLASLAKRPFDWVIWAFPWGEENTELEERSGPDVWQKAVLLDIQAKLLAGYCNQFGAIREAIRSGHGVGKSALLSWLVWWAISTAADTRGRVTANTEKQLRTVLWAEVNKWHGLFLARHLFKTTATAIYSADPQREKNWRIDAIPWSEDNPEAFAGLHNYGKRLLVVFDEASAISDKIWEVIEGAMTDANTEILFVVTGNPTRNFGNFRECFYEGSAWTTWQVNAEDSAFSNKEMLATWRNTHGWDSDFYRVRVRGEWPNASELQLIPVELVLAARKRDPIENPFDALLLAVDVARFGSNESVAVFRQGRDARRIKADRRRGLNVVECAYWVAGLIKTQTPDAVFVDEGGVGGGVVDVLRSLGHQVYGVNFGAKPNLRPGGQLVGNKRAEMYVSLRDWLREGGAIEDSNDLHQELVSVEYHYNLRTEIILMSKEDMRMIGRPSPDWADALAMTFAYPVQKRHFRSANQATVEYDPLSYENFKREIANVR